MVTKIWNLKKRSKHDLYIFIISIIQTTKKLKMIKMITLVDLCAIILASPLSILAWEFIPWFQRRFIMVIELSGVQFGLKSYAWFQNQTSSQREFDFKSQVWFRTKIARPEVQLPLYYIHFEITQFNSLNTRTTRTTKFAKFAKQEPFCLSFSSLPL